MASTSSTRPPLTAASEPSNIIQKPLSELFPSTSPCLNVASEVLHALMVSPVQDFPYSAMQWKFSTLVPWDMPSWKHWPLGLGPRGFLAITFVSLARGDSFREKILEPPSALTLFMVTSLDLYP